MKKSIGMWKLAALLLLALCAPMIYAQAAGGSYTVSFNANGGTGTMTAQTVTVGAATALKKNTFTRAGYVFDAWNTAANGSGTPYADQASVYSIAKDTVLYAQWKADANTCVVTFHPNTGTYKTGTQTMTKGTARALTTLSALGYRPGGCTFRGWSTASNGSGTTYKDGESVTLTGNLDLYAQWDRNSYTVYFDANGGYGDEMAPQEFLCGVSQSLRWNKYKNDGNLKFAGWALTRDGSVRYSDGESVYSLSTVDGDAVTLYAIWRGSGASAQIRLERGGVSYGKMSGYIGEDYYFSAKTGVYNLVTESGGKTMTSLVKSSKNDISGVVDVPDASVSSILTVKSGTPEVVVGNLDTAAYDSRRSGYRVVLRMTVEKKTESGTEQQQAIRKSYGSGALDFYDLALSRTVDGATDKTFQNELSRNLLIYLPLGGRTAENVVVYRWHDGAVQELTRDTSREEYIGVEDDWLVIHARRFSTYAVGSADRAAATEQTPAQTGYAAGVSGCLRGASCPIDTYYVDSSPSAWYHDGVHWALARGVMRGYSPHCFGPDDQVTRASLVTMLWRLEGSPNSSRALPFTDVPDDAWYATAVRWATGAGIINGRSGRLFEPEGTLTREELATALYRHCTRKKTESAENWMFLPGFSDMPEVSGWAYEAINWMALNGIFEGTLTSSGNRMLRPKWAATRAETAEVIMRYWNYYTA